MQINEKIQEIESKLPYGSYSEIARRAKTSPAKVRDFFKLRKQPNHKAIKQILPIAIEFIKEFEDILKKG